VVPKLGGANRSGARNIEFGARNNCGNAPELNYQLMKLSLLTVQNPQKVVQLAANADVLRLGSLRI
jgi:hypothetical protein